MLTFDSASRLGCLHDLPDDLAAGPPQRRAGYDPALLREGRRDSAGGTECGPVQDRLRALVHEQRAATRGRLEELTQLAADLNAVSATIGDAACGPDCACVKPIASAAGELPLAPERLIGAACSLNSEEIRERLAEWRSLRDRATTVEDLPGGARLTFAAGAPVAPIADLVGRESECCSFYTFDLRIDGAARQLDISAGAGGAPAVRALLGLQQ